MGQVGQVCVCGGGGGSGAASDALPARFTALSETNVFCFLTFVKKIASVEVERTARSTEPRFGSTEPVSVQVRLQPNMGARNLRAAPGSAQPNLSLHRFRCLDHVQVRSAQVRLEPNL